MAKQCKWQEVEYDNVGTPINEFLQNLHKALVLARLDGVQRDDIKIHLEADYDGMIDVSISYEKDEMDKR